MKRTVHTITNRKKLKKVIFCDFDDIRNPLLGAGQAKATLEVGSRLAKKGYQVVVYCSRYPHSKDRTENSIEYKHIGLGSSNIRLNNIVYIFSLPFFVARAKADIILECFTAPISTLFSPLFTKIPVVGLPTSFEAERFSKLYHFPFDKIERFGLGFYTYLLPYTKVMEKKMKLVNNRAETRIVPEGVGKEFFSLRRSSPQHILFLGRFDMGQKGIDLLLQAYAKVHKKVKYPLVLAGYGPDEEKIHALVRELGIEERVQFVGGAFGEKKNTLLAQSVFVAFPSRHEGFSLFSLEALASGLGMVSFDIDGLSWAPTDIVLKAKLGDVNGYAEQMLKACTPSVADKMGKRAREFAKFYSWDNVAEQFDVFFRDILGRKSL